jgi:hypothetical protein
LAVETDPPVEQLYVHEGYYLTHLVQVAAAAAANTYKNMAMCIKATYLTPLVCSTREIPGFGSRWSLPPKAAGAVGALAYKLSGWQVTHLL